ncbi:MAG: pseudouridine synthase [Pirellulaceae bacterium]|nr:MAG: pseudouridine synthase [Pirellulaceae bacterium]
MNQRVPCSTDERLRAGEPVELVVEPGREEQRVDLFLAEHFRWYSRTQLRQAVVAGQVTVDGKVVKCSFRVRPGQRVRIVLPEKPRETPAAENIPIEVLYEDEDLVVINKPAGMVVHPARGHWTGTLAGALTYHFSQLSTVGGPTRPGIVHRLDRDTSGVIVVAKNDQAHMALTAQFQDRKTKKEYLALTWGCPDRDRDLIDAPIGVHPYQREKMAIRAQHPTSRDAQTFYEVLRRWERVALLRVVPYTGRTHQIRVHLEHIGCPVLCDRLYSGRAQITEGELLGGAEGGPVILARQALHASRLEFAHPMRGTPVSVEAPLPDDIRRAIQLLEHTRPPQLPPLADNCRIPSPR